MSTKIIQVISISTALMGAGGIATLSLFDVPILQSQPASRSLPSGRWLFSRGYHLFPSAAIISSSGFFYLAYNALPPTDRALSTLLRHVGTSRNVGLYLAAAALTISIAPVTQFLIPTNFTLIRKNEEKGGSRSALSAKEGTAGGRSAEESVDGKNDVSQFSDLCGPQEKTKKDSNKEDDKEVQDLLKVFGKMNASRAVLMGLGGIVGLMAALA